MQGSFWYLALVVIGTIVVANTYWKSRNKHTFTLWFSISGVCLFIESFLHTIMRAYEFFPRFIPDKYADSIWGGFISDIFVLPPVAVLISVFQLGLGWIIVISGMIAGIEELFLKLGIYEQYWWKTSYTFILIILLFYIAKVWFRRLNRPHEGSLTFITMLSILFTFSIQLHLSINLHLKQGQFISQWIKALGINSNIIAVPKNLFIFLLFARVIVLFIGLAFDRLLRNNEVHSE